MGDRGEGLQATATKYEGGGGLVALTAKKKKSCARKRGACLEKEQRDSIELQNGINGGNFYRMRRKKVRRRRFSNKETEGV